MMHSHERIALYQNIHEHPLFKDTSRKLTFPYSWLFVDKVLSTI